MGNTKACLNEYSHKDLIKEFGNWSSGVNPMIRKIGFLHLANNMSDNDVAKLKRFFIELDEDDDGLVSRQELTEYFNYVQE